MDRNQEYIRLLQERNRMKKALSEKSDEEQQKEELERGFSINFRGANAVKQSSLKALDKPMVKVQKGISADIAKRLLGANIDDIPADSNSTHSKKRWSGDDCDVPPSEEAGRSRSTSVLRRRNSNGHDTISPRCNDNIENESEIDPSPTSRKQLQVKASSKGQPQVDDVLLTRIKSMNAEQKRALLDLLQISDPTVGTENNEDFIDNKNDYETEEQEWKLPVLDSEKETAGQHENVEHVVEEIVRERKETKESYISQNDNSIPLESLPTTARNPASCDWLKRKLSFRVKIFSTWDDCKNCVLQALRLRLRINHQFLDILQSLKLQICCGLNVLPTSMEVYRKFPVLVSAGHSSSLLEQWKGPVTLTQPLEFVFEGYINEPDNFVLSDHFDNMDSLLRQLQLCIWNGFQEDSGVNYSPVKDMDVYFDGKCIWSGQVPTESLSVDVTKVSSLVSSPLKYESAASVVIPMLPGATSQLPSSRDSSVKIRKEKLLEDESDDDTNSINQKSTLKLNNIKGNDSTLDWLTSANKKNIPSIEPVKDSLNFYVTNPRTSIKRADDIFFDSPPRSKASSSDHDTLKNLKKSPSAEAGMLAMIPDDAIPVKKAVSRGSRRHLQKQNHQQLDIIPESGDIPQSKAGIPTLNYTPSMSGLTRQGSSSQFDDDAMLRRSLDAIQKAEKFNLNRLEKTKDMDKLIFTSQEDALAAVTADAPVFARKRTSPAPKLSSPTRGASNNTDDGIGSTSSAKTTFSGEKQPARQPVYFSPGSPTTIHKQNKSQVGSISPTSRLEKRAANIGEFSSKLTSKLNEVNGILAQLPRKPSFPLFPSSADIESVSPEVNNSNDQTSHTVHKVLSAHKLVVPVNSGIAPSCRVLSVWIFSTHGDNNYVGLNGIELFDAMGQYIPFSAISRISAIPADLTIMPGYEDDPRKVTNLLDGVNLTKDDLHQWLAPHIHVASDFVSSSDQIALAEGKSLLDEVSPLAMIRIEFPVETKLSMIRVYNFNKSRTHNQRGVKSIRIDLDGLAVFNGEVAKATGQVGKLQSKEGEDFLSIPLCVDTQVLDNIAHQSQALQLPEVEEEVVNALEESMISVQSRPKTAAPPDDSLSQVVLLGDNTTQLSFNEESDPMLEIADGEDLAADTAAVVVTAEQAAQDSLQASSDFLHAILQETDAIQMRSAYQQRLQQAKTASTTSLGSYLQQPPKEESASSKSGKLSSNVSRPMVDAITLAPTNSVNTAPSSSAVHYVSTLTVRHIRLELLASWGDSEYIGLGGIEVLNVHGQALRLTKQMLRCDSCMDASFVGFGSGGGSGDRSDLNQLLIAGHDTSNTQSMWLIPQDHDRKKIVLDIDLQAMQEIIGLKIWNYNGTTMDESLRGTKILTIIFDQGRVVLSNLLLRAGPMFDGIRFAQLITFDRWLEARSKLSSSLSTTSNRIGGGPLAYITPRLKQTYEVLHPISGMSFVFSFFSNHGDHYYMGLDRMEFLDEELQVIDVLSLAEVTAVPYSVRDLANSASADTSLSQDPRIPPALFLESHSQNTNSNSMQHTWLAPLARSMLPAERDACVHRIHPNKAATRSSILPNDNTLFVLAHFPIKIAAIRIWNYSKTPSRGVKDFCLSIDGNTIFMGSLLISHEEKKVDALSRTEVPGTSRGQVILFSNETKFVNQFKDLVVTASAGDQDVLCINERQVMVRSKTMYQEPPSQIDIQQRPTTSFVRR